MPYQLPALEQLSRNLPKFFIQWVLQKRLDAEDRRPVEFVGRVGQPNQPVNNKLPPRLGQGANLF